MPPVSKLSPLPAHAKAPKKKSDITRRRMLDAAAKVLRNRGYAGTRLSEIAEVANTLAGSIYYYFPSKDALVEEVLQEGHFRNFRAVMSAVERLGPSVSPLDRLVAAIRAHVEMTLEQDDYASASIRIFGNVPEEIRARHLVVQRQYGAYWRELILAAQGAGLAREELDPSVTRMLLLGMLNWSVEWYRSGRLDAGEIAEQAAHLFMNGFRKDGP